MTIRIPYAFAESGDTNAIPDTPSTVEVSWSQGYTAAYELEDTEPGYRYVERDENNYILNSLSGNTKHWQEKTYPEWFSDIAYAKNKVFVYDVNGETYICIADASAGTLPTNTSYFSALQDFYDDLVNAANLTGTAPTSAIPNLPASKITSGVLGSARLPSATTSSIGAVETSTSSELIAGAVNKFPDASQILDVVMPAGEIRAMATQTLPPRALKCNGDPYSRTAYSRLFAAIGTTYGDGDGSTTFNVPDLRGEFLRGWDDGRGVDNGRAFGSDQIDALQGHGHRLSGQSAPDGETPNGDRVSYPVRDGEQTLNNFSNNTEVNDLIDNGENGAPRVESETRPRNVAIMYVITY